MKKCFSLETPHELTRYNCVEQVYLVYRELDEWVPDGSSARRAVLCARRHLVLHVEICRAKPSTWCLYPKHHSFVHACTFDGPNPNMLWNYGEEDEIGTASDRAGNRLSNRTVL